MVLETLDSHITKIGGTVSEAEDKRDCSKLKDQFKLASEPCEQILKKSRDINNKLRELKAKFEELHKKHIAAIENDDPESWLNNIPTALT